MNGHRGLATIVRRLVDAVDPGSKVRVRSPDDKGDQRNTVSRSRHQHVHPAHRASRTCRLLLGVAFVATSLGGAACVDEAMPDRNGVRAETAGTAEGSGAVDSTPDADISSRPWDEARARGVEFRAVGQEPGWSLDLDQGRTFHYTGDYGRTQVTLPATAPVRDSAGVVMYRVQADGHDLTVVVEALPCQDAMSGEEFTHAVTIRLDDHELEGCGRTLMTAEVTNTYWRLAELGGQPALPGAEQREPHIRLLADSAQVTGSTGCNTLRGPFELDGDSIRFGAIATTRMACVDPGLSGQEQEFLRALEEATRVSVERDTLTLHDGDRSVARFAAVPLR